MLKFSDTFSRNFFLSRGCEYITKDPFADICLPISYFLSSSVSLSNFSFYIYFLIIFHNFLMKIDYLHCFLSRKGLKGNMV
jgi:hypothetical protein